eukprot:5731055-Pyramimonas_sp.AAC.1
MPDSGLCVGAAFNEDTDAENASRGAHSEDAGSEDSYFLSRRALFEDSGEPGVGAARARGGRQGRSRDIL